MQSQKRLRSLFPSYSVRLQCPRNTHQIMSIMSHVQICISSTQQQGDSHLHWFCSSGDLNLLHRRCQLSASRQR